MVFPDETPSEVHPSRTKSFADLCGLLTEPLQRCVSPFHAGKHQAECDDARAKASRVAQFRIGMIYTIITPDEDLSTPWGEGPP